MVALFIACSSTVRCFGATRTRTLWTPPFRSALNMPDATGERCMRWWLRFGVLAVSFSELGCSTLDVRDRGFAHQRHGAVSFAGTSAIASPPVTLPRPPDSASTAAVDFAQSPAQADDNGSDITAQPGVAQPRDALSGGALNGGDMSGGARGYLKALGDMGAAPKDLATRYANLQPGACRAEVRRRRIMAVSAQGVALGVATPMRVTGALRGVRFVTPGPRSKHGILDCRLLLVLDELAAVLVEQGVAVVYVDGFYRPKAHLPGSKSPSQHAFGLAVDIHGFGMKDGTGLVIERDFAGGLGAPVCGADAMIQPESRASLTLRNVACAIARSKAFHYLLTPNYDAAHANHWHGDIKRGSKQHVLR